MRSSDPNGDRYASLKLIEGWDQQRIAKARVMVVGAGALGNEVLKNLALIGVGNLLVVDFDVIESPNLAKSVLFRAEDCGKRKAEIAAQRVYELNPEVNARFLHGDVTYQLGTGVYQYVDVVIGGLDNMAARWAVNRACWRVGTPWVEGGLLAMDGIMRVFVPPQGGCYGCTLTAQDYPQISQRFPCHAPAGHPGRIPTAPTTASIIGGIQVQEAIKLLLGMEVKPGTGLMFYGLPRAFRAIEIPHNPTCICHEQYECIVKLDTSCREMTVAQLLAIAQQHLGPEAVIELDHPVVTSWHCPSCQKEEKVMQLYAEFAPGRAVCAGCEKDLVPDVVQEISQDMPFINATCAEMGIPVLHILCARGREQHIYFEFSKDVEEVLGCRWPREPYPGHGKE